MVAGWRRAAEGRAPPRGTAVFWWVQGYAAEARRWTDELLARESTVDERSRGQIHLVSGLAAAWEGDYCTRRRCSSAQRPNSASWVAARAPAWRKWRWPTFRQRVPTTSASEALLLESAADLYQAGDLWAVNVALQSRAEVALAAGEFQRATALYDDSLELANRHDRYSGSSAGAGRTWLCRSRRGSMLPAAEDLLQQGLELSMQLSNPELLAFALRGLAGVASGTTICSGARLLGAAQALSDAAGTVDWPVRRRLYMRFEQEVRDGLGLAGYADAYAVGRALSLAEAAGFARLADRMR